MPKASHSVTRQEIFPAGLADQHLASTSASAEISGQSFRPALSEQRGMARLGQTLYSMALAAIVGMFFSWISYLQTE